LAATVNFISCRNLSRSLTTHGLISFTLAVVGTCVFSSQSEIQ
jgi:hypothetical protein